MSQKGEVGSKFNKPDSDIRFINDFKRHLNSNSQYKNDYSHPVVDASNKALVESSESLTSTQYKGVSSGVPINDLDTKYQDFYQVSKTYASHKESAVAGNQSLNTFSNKETKEVDKSQLRSATIFKKSTEQETGLKFSLLGNGKSILAIRSYKSDSTGLINWVTSKLGYSLDSIIVNGKKIFSAFGGR